MRWARWLLGGGLILALCLASGVIGGALSQNFGESSYKLSYADFISIMLTAVSLLMTLLAFFIAGLAYIGWNSISSKVGSEVLAYLDRGFREGEPLHKILVENKNAVMFEGVRKVDTEFNRDADAEQAEGDL